MDACASQGTWRGSLSGASCSNSPVIPRPRRGSAWVRDAKCTRPRTNALQSCACFATPCSPSPPPSARVSADRRPPGLEHFLLPLVGGRGWRGRASSLDTTCVAQFGPALRPRTCCDWTECATLLLDDMVRFNLISPVCRGGYTHLWTIRSMLVRQPLWLQGFAGDRHCANKFLQVFALWGPHHDKQVRPTRSKV